MCVPYLAVTFYIKEKTSHENAIDMSLVTMNGEIFVLNCQKCNLCLKCHKSLYLCLSGHVSSSLGLNASLYLVMFLLGHFLGPIWCFDALKSLPMIYFGCF